MFKLEKELKSGVRIGKLETPHGVIETPFFMPVGTVGSVKAMAPWELEELGAQIVLANTYHLYLRPGEKNIKELGGLHRFMNWNKPILTDSGGYQVFSLARGNNHNKKGNPVILDPSAGILSEMCHFDRSGEIFEMSQKISRQARDDTRCQISPTVQQTSRGRNDNTGSLVKITEEGIEFKSHLDGSSHLFTPEKVIDIQLDLGVDILMPLDICPSGTASRQEVEESVRLTTLWAKRSKIHFENRLKSKDESLKTDEQTKDQRLKTEGERLETKDKRLKTEDQSFSHSSSVLRPLLHGIVQGGLCKDLREQSARELIALDFDGYSVGGLAVDFETRDMWEMVKLMGEVLPADKQRYLMGVGTPDDIIKATKLGMDMFDCVLPTRLARHGSIYIKRRMTDDQSRKTEGESKEFCHSERSEESLVREDPHALLNPPSGGLALAQDDNLYKLVNLLKSEYRLDGGAIDTNCKCRACRGIIGSANNPEISPERDSAAAYAVGFSRAYIAHLLRSNEILGLRLTTLHNLHTYLELMREIRSDTD